MTKKIVLLTVVTLATLLAIFSLLIEVVNPHSFLGPLGAGIRAVVIFILASIWLQVCPVALKGLKHYGFVLCVLTAFIYVCEGVNLFVIESAWNEIQNK